MTEKISSTVSATIDLLITYKRGELNLEETVSRFSFLTGINEDISSRYISELSRDNVSQLLAETRNDLFEG